MGDTSKYQLIYCTCPDLTSAKQIAKALVTNHLAACVNLVPNITSIYKWQGSVEESNEYLLIIKSIQKNYSKLEQLILKQHPYELPEIIAVPFNNGLPAYLAWLDNNTTR